MIQVLITRREFKEQTGHTPEPESVGIMIYTPNGHPIREYIFIDEVFPVSKPAQISELERLYTL